MMTAHRFKQLLNGATPANDAEQLEFARQLKSQKRREAARRAVATKAEVYTSWPTRANIHRKRDK